MRSFLVAAVFSCLACSNTTGGDAGADASSCTTPAPQLTCCSYCGDDVRKTPSCVDGAWQCVGFSPDTCHCGVPCSLQKFPFCNSCDDGGYVAHVCNFTSGSGHPYECPAGSYDRDDPDAAAALCGMDAGVTD